MREILFRGKSKECGYWVEGNYCFRCAPLMGIMDIPSIQTVSGDDFRYIAVSPETVGQFTGLTDKNGKKIFEGDILGGYLDEDYPDNKTVVVVEWHENMWVTRQGKCLPDLLEQSDSDCFEIIGNIYDNLELLKGD